MMDKSRRTTAVFLSLVMVISLMPGLGFTAAAEASAYGYGTNVLQNPMPTSNDYWELDECSYGKYLDMGNSSEPSIIGAKSGTDIAVRQRVTLTDADVIRANNGELTVEGSGKFYAQGSRNLTANLNIICYNEAGTVLHTYNDRDSGYSVSGRTKTLSISASQIPAGTAYIVYEGTEELGSGAAYFGMYDFSMVFRDTTAPSVSNAPYLYAVNGDTTLPAYVVPGDKVTYAMKFSEAVAVSVFPSMDLSIGNGVSFDTTYSADRQTVYFTTTLANTGTNTSLQLKKLSDIYVKDDAGNESSSTYPSLSVGNVPYKSVFDVTNNLTNLSLSGASTVRYGNAYTATLIPAAGYKLPESITVKVNGGVITDYNYNQSNGKILINASAVTGDIEITAVGAPQTYTITFDMQGGSGGTESIAVTYTQGLSPVTPPTKAGYTFGGYYTEAIGAGVQYYSYDGNSAKTYDKTSDLTLYAKWSAKSYTVTLDAAGGTGSGTITAVYDADMPSITKPTKAGYTFGGYFTQQNGGGEKYYNANGTSAKQYDKTDGFVLYAKWSANSYTVTFDMQGGIGGTASENATYDSAMPSITPPTRIGYTFGGYYTAANGAGTQYYYVNGESAKAYDIDGACTLYAKWTANTYDVVLNASGGSGGSTVTAAYDSDMPVIAAPDKPGYLFSGYFDGKNGRGTKYYNADCSSAKTYDKAEGITLYALWTPITYNIQLYSRGEYVGALNDVTYGELRLPSAESLGISFANHNFVGWNIYDEQNWAMYTAERTYSAGLVTEQGKTAYIYAAWLEKDKYTVTYDANGGVGAPAAVEVHVDETITLSDIVPSRENYTFVGWSENSESASAQYQPNDSFTMGNSLVTLFAVWNKNPELTYNANGGTFSTYVGVSYPAAGSTVTLTGAVPQKDGYVFRGWAESETAAVDEIISSPYIMPNHDTVLYAVYEPIKYAVSVNTADGYSVLGIAAGGYTLGEYAEFTVSGTNPKVYINGILSLPINGAYKFEVKNNSAVVVCSTYSVNVVYNANSGINAPVDMHIYTNGDTAVIASGVPARTGYSFRGWAKTQDADSAEYTGGESIPVAAEDIILYAVWEPITYTIKYAANGGNGDMSATAAVYDESITLSENTFTKSGCQFVGWSYAADGELAYANGVNVKNLTDTQNGEITLYAVWKGAETTVRFRFEGGSSGTAFCEAVYGELLPTDKLTAPNRYGYIFAGYYTAPNKGGNLVYNADMSLSEHYRTHTWDSVLSEFDLYAAWEPVNYTVAFVNGTETLANTVYAVYGQSFRLPRAEILDISVPQGHSFMGWSVASGSDTVYYSDGQEITTGLTGENGAVVYLYAVIQKNVSYTVTLSASGDGYKVYYNGNELTSQTDIKVNQNEDISFSISVEDGYSSDKMTVLANGIMLGATQISGRTYNYNIKNVSADTVITVEDVKTDVYTVKYIVDGEKYHSENVEYSGNAQKPKAPVKAGYTFDGWFVGNEEWDFANDIEGDLELVAKFTPLTYRLTVPVNQSEFTVNVKSDNPVEYGGSFTFDIIVSEGYNVSDMMVYANGVLLEKDSENGNTVSFSITNITEEKVITVRGIGQNTYAVTYRANTTDYVGNMPENVIKAYDNNIAVSDLVPERYGYDFIGWSTAENGTAQYHAGDTYSENSDLTLYAVWKAKTFTVSFETSGGNITGGEITEYTYGTNIALPTEVAKEGYDFAGWYEDELLQGVRVYEIKASDYGNKKYYAAYSVADVPVNGYLGEYDGNAHNITYALADNLSVEKYQWYFVPEGASNATAVQSDSYNSYAVTEVADSGEYYCYIKALIDEYVIRFFTERATVKITKKPVSVKAADSSKVYDAQPLAENGIELTDGSSLAENHTISVVMTADSTITKVGTQTNVIDLVTILDIDGKNVTENYEITKQNGTLSVTPLTLTVTAENTSVSAGSVLNENRLYKINDALGDEKLSLVNTSVTAKNANGEEIAFADITKNAGTYTVTISYSGFDGEGSENYRGSGTVTSTVTVYKRSSGGSSGGGSTSTAYTVKFDTDGESEIESRTEKADGTESTSERKNPFTDVKESDWFYNNVKYANENGLMNGTSNTTFSPDGIITRAMMVAVLYRAEGEPEITGTTTFEDVDSNAYYAKAVVWGQQNGIVNGVTENAFAPDDNITREQIAAIMFRYAKYKGYDVSVGESTNILSYTDFDEISEYAISAMQWTCGSGLMKGKTETTINPRDNATRAEIAAILQRFIETNK